MRDLGKADRCLAIEFKQKDGFVYLKLRSDAENILNCFNMENCKPVSTLCEVRLNLIKPKERNKYIMQKYPYQSSVEALMYLAVTIILYYLL